MCSIINSCSMIKLENSLSSMFIQYYKVIVKCIYYTELGLKYMVNPITTWHKAHSHFIHVHCLPRGLKNWGTNVKSLVQYKTLWRFKPLAAMFTQVGPILILSFCCWKVKGREKGRGEERIEKERKKMNMEKKQKKKKNERNAIIDLMRSFSFLS